MRKNYIALIMTMVLAVLLTACGSSGNDETAYESSMTTKEMTDSVTKQYEQPSLMELPAENVSTLYHLDPELLEEYTILIPLMNVKTNEISVLKVKDSKDIATVEEAVKQRAADVQKQFETYLPDQYENAKNYKLVTKGNYVIFVISDKADELIEAFDSFFVRE
jgi:soluble cytochrome b562